MDTKTHISLLSIGAFLVTVVAVGLMVVVLWPR